MAETIGVVGVGLVGTALAGNLLEAGFGVAGFDVDSERLGHLEKIGGRPASSPREVAQRARRVFLALMSTDIVREAVEGPQGLLRAETPPTHIVDCSTGDPDETVALARRLEDRGVRFLDAPISGSSEMIRRREGVFMVGGDPEAFEGCADLFAAVARRAYHVGPSGGGSKAKLASNLILGLNRLALAEGLVFAERLGLDLESFLALLKKTPAYSCAMDAKGDKLLEKNYEPQSRLAQHGKDLGIILEYAARSGQPLPLGRLHKEIIDAAVEAGDGGLDSCAVIEQIRRMKDS